MTFARSSFVSKALLRSLALGAVCGFLLAARATAASDDDAFMVNIRTTIERPYTLFSKKPPVVHSKLYSLAWIKTLAKPENPLVAPVNENALLQELHDVLATHGFKEPEAGKVPDIVLTVLYGRSRLKNPYQDPSIAVIGGTELQGGGPGAANVGGGVSGNYQSQSAGPGNNGGGQVVGGMDMIMEERTPGAREKRLKADDEKVFISITAWEYPGFIPSPKPKLLWRTTMNVDDPTLDLNEVCGKILAVGAPYFDREIKQKEITVSSAVAAAVPEKSSLSDSGAGKQIR